LTTVSTCNEVTLKYTTISTLLQGEDEYLDLDSD